MVLLCGACSAKMPDMLYTAFKPDYSPIIRLEQTISKTMMSRLMCTLFCVVLYDDNNDMDTAARHDAYSNEGNYKDFGGPHVRVQRAYTAR